MSESHIITTPRRHSSLLTQVQNVFNASLSPQKCDTLSKGSTIIITRKLESYHHALLDSGCQSAKSSPLSHRRLDKLEGVIRDKPITTSMSTMQRSYESDDNSSSCDSSPACLRKRTGSVNAVTDCHRFISNHQESPMPYRKHQLFRNDKQPCNTINRKNSEGEIIAVTNKSQKNADPIGAQTMRHRGKASYSCIQKSLYQQIDSEYICSPQIHHRITNNAFTLPTKSVLGEPGCFSSPMHSSSKFKSSARNTGFISSMEGIYGEQSDSSYPACAANSNPFNKNIDLNDANISPVQPDQTVVSGWLKFRDNKRVSLNYFHLIFRTQHFNLVKLT